jgi:peptide-N4-(N-acetyl-beta-glucosaminyl)asparagine amidase
MNQREQQFLARVTNAIQQAYQYQDENLKAKARSVMPVEDINNKARIDYNAERELNQPNQKSLENHIIRHLLSWFKGSFFTWTNNPPCDSCKSTNTKLIGGVAPNAYEQQGLAGVVELYQCSDCQQNTRFPRYNHAGRLLETKRGRCGEWAQAFTLCCNALGYEARFVNDWTDHVWTEVYIDSRWQHADSCEQVLDAPMVCSIFYFLQSRCTKVVGEKSYLL